MKKNLITAVGLVSLVVLSYVGIAQLGGNGKVVKESDAMDIEQPEDETMSEASQCETGSDGLVTCKSGLQYKIEKAGNGNCPEKGQKVTVHYTGWLDDNGKIGKKFDSSVDRGTPFSFDIGLGQVIAGWDEGVSTMKVGEKRHLIIPANLGYGARGAGGVIPPNAKLRFDVELLNLAKNCRNY